MLLRSSGLITLALLYSLSSLANAELQAEIEAETAQKANPQITTQEVYVIQGQDQEQAQGQKVQAQPITVVEAAPLIQSNADQLRTARQQAEVETEQKIVEKLETSRLEDEKRRADALFGGKLEKNTEVQAKAVAEVEIEKEEKPQQPAQIVIIEKETPAPVQPAVIKEEIAVVDEKSSDKGRMSFSGHLGVLEYEAYNIDSDIATGAAIGWAMDNGMQVEASFTYSNHILKENYYQFQEMEQYNWSMAAKYAFLRTKIRPVVGGILGLTQRTYSIPLNPGLGDDSFDSTALDAGFIVGAELQISDNMMIGADYRNIVNLTTRYDYPENRRGEIDTIEEDGYSMFSANLKFVF